jgi:hypothetical protein
LYEWLICFALCERLLCFAFCEWLFCFACALTYPQAAPASQRTLYAQYTELSRQSWAVKPGTFERRNSKHNKTTVVWLRCVELTGEIDSRP